MSGVFISYASADSALADALVAALEAHDIRCWISGRDVPPGANYQEAIVGAISGARAMVLLLTEAANASDEMKKELSLASAQGIAVYPVRIGEVQPNAALRYELATRQWIEGSDVQSLAARLSTAIQGGGMPRQDDDAASLTPMGRASIAVLAFDNMSGDAEQTYFADGVAEDIIAGLSRHRWLFVIARNSSFFYRGRQTDIRQVGRELGVRYVLSGSVRRSGGRLRVSAQLNDAATGSHVWAEKYDGAAEEVFDLQDRITEAVVGILDPTIREAEILRARRERPTSLAAYDHYLRAIALNDVFTRESTAAMLEHCRRSIALDPNFVPAYAICVRASIQRYTSGWMEDEARERTEAVELAEEGLRRDRVDSLMLATAGQAFAWLAQDLDRGIACLDEAVALNPNNAHTLINSGIVRLRAGQTRVAIEHLNRAIRLSPRDSRHYATFAALAQSHLLEHEFDVALEWAQRAVRHNANYAMGWRELAAASVLLGQDSESRQAVERMLAIEPGYTIAKQRVRYPTSTPEKYEILYEALRRAGVPE